MNVNPKLSFQFLTFLASFLVPARLSAAESTFAYTGQTRLEGEEGTITLKLNPPARIETPVSYEVLGSENPSDDHSLSNGTLIFYPGESVKKIVFSVVDDKIPEADKRVLIRLRATEGISLGQIPEHTLIISDTDSSLTLLPNGLRNPNSRYLTTPSLDMTLIQKSGAKITDLSGITYCPERSTYYSVRNNKTTGGILEFSPFYLNTGNNSTRTLSHNFSSSKSEYDLEDIVSIGSANGLLQFALVNESNQVFICNFPNNSNDYVLKKNIDCKNINVLGINFESNKGLEGITYNPQNQRFYVVREGGAPGLGVYTFVMPPDGEFTNHDGLSSTPLRADVTATPVFDAMSKLSRYAKDLSGIYYEASTERFFIMSHQSRIILDVKSNGTVVGMHRLPSGRQYEGLSFDPQQNLVTVSEPNILTLYEKQ